MRCFAVGYGLCFQIETYSIAHKLSLISFNYFVTIFQKIINHENGRLDPMCFSLYLAFVSIFPIAGKPRCTIKSPSGKDVPVNMIDNGDGTYTGQWTPTEEGVHDVDVTFGGEPVRGSPFKVEAVRQPVMEDIQAVSANDVESALPSEEGPDRVIAFGKGLEKGIVQEPCEFTVITKDAGPGGLSLAVEGPSKAEIHCVDNGDGSCSVSYLPEKPGMFISVV